MNNHFPADDKTRVAGMPDFSPPPSNDPQQAAPPVTPQPPAWPPQEPPQPAATTAPPVWASQEPPPQAAPAAPSWPPQEPAPPVATQPPAWATPDPPPQPTPSPNPPVWAPTPEPAPPPPTQQPPNWAAQPVQPTAPPPPSWQPQEPAQPAAALARPATAAPSQDLYRLSSQQDDMWFVVEPPSKPVRHPLRQGEAVTVGREATQNVVIEEKTLSRNHLVLRRNGNRVAVQILGLNGMVYANQVHKSTTLELTAPASLTIGNVVCKIEKKYDTDATVLMSDPAAASRHQPGGGGHAAPSAPSWSPSPQQPYAPLPPEGRHPFADSPAAGAGYPPGQPTPGYNPPPGSSPSYGFGQSAHPGDRDPGGFAPHRADAPDGANKNRLLLLIGGAALAALLIGGGLYYWLGSKPATPVAPPSAATTVQPPAPAITSGGCTGGNQGANNLYAKYLSKAATLLKEGNSKDACDYLKDIPQNSACWPEALSLAKQIEGCTLE